MKCDTVGATHKYNYMYIYRTIHDIGWERWGIKKYRKYKYSEENRDNIS